MKLNRFLFFSLLAGCLAACHKEADVVKTDAQIAADKKAIEIRAAADQKTLDANEAAFSKAAGRDQETLTPNPEPVPSN